jgi:hypothetical protein
MEDYYTNDVEGAEGFERYHNSDDNYDNDRDYDEQHDEDSEDDCNCSDPGCPCGGNKIGSV